MQYLKYLLILLGAFLATVSAMAIEPAIAIKPDQDQDQTNTTTNTSPNTKLDLSKGKITLSDGQIGNLPSKWGTIDLADPDLETIFLPSGELNTSNPHINPIRRDKIPTTVCESPYLGECLRVKQPYDVAEDLGQIIKGQASRHDCSTVIGTIGRLTYQYYATARDCNTEASSKAMGGALLKWLDHHDFEVCGTWCLNLDHKGNWNGWLKLGMSEHFDKDAVCAGGMQWGDCVTGNDGDLRPPVVSLDHWLGGGDD